MFLNPLNYDSMLYLSTDDILATGLKIIDGQIYILDQQVLPHKEKWLIIESPQKMIQYIKDLKVRGAPIIAISAALVLAGYAEQLRSECSGEPYINEVKKVAALLRNARPTAVNLANAIDELMQIPTTEWWEGGLATKAIQLFNEDKVLCDKLAQIGLPLLPQSGNCLTICNTGRIATCGIGTALGVFYKAHENNLPIHVYACETRPLLQGGRLTAWELKKHNVPFTLLIDHAAASLFQNAQIDAVFIGADRIARNGDTANKIGSYNLAVLAKHHNIPFYIVAPHTTVDHNCSNGQEIKIEQRSEEEVRGVKLKRTNFLAPDNTDTLEDDSNDDLIQISWTPDNIKTYNPAFDVTPANLITGIILDTGYFNQQDILNGSHL
jgi:methylthioribose-1-phosphate isomerase